MSTAVEQALLVLLHVLVVGQREAVQHAVQPHQPRGDARRLRAQQLGRVGVLLLRHDRGPRGPGVRDLAEAELLAGPQHDLRPQAREVGRAGRGGRQEVEHEVAVGDRVDRVRRHRRRSRARAPGSRGRCRSSRRPARPRRAAGRSSSRARTRSAARRAGTSRSTRAGGARGRPAARAAGAYSPASASRDDGRRAWTSALCRRWSDSRVPSACARVNIAMSVATWSLRERAVCSLPPTGPTISVSRRSIAMWTSSSASSKRNSPSSSSRPTRSSPFSSASRSASLMIAGGGQHRRVRARLLDVVGASRQSKPMDALSCRKTGSWGWEKRDTEPSSWRHGADRAPRPAGGSGRRAPVRIGQALLRRLRRHRGPRAAAARRGSTGAARTLRAGSSATWPRPAARSSACSPASRRGAARSSRAASSRSRSRGSRRGAGPG